MNMEKSVLGIEFGSTRIKAVLLDEHNNPIASGGCNWENKFENGVWTYSLEEVTVGLQSAYKALCENLGQAITTLAGMGISGMMHGYLVFDTKDNQLCEFRTWRNTITQESAEALTKLFDFNVPQRWSIAHLYQAMLNKESHVPQIARMTTLAGHIHYLLTGENVMGVGEASGMFPIENNQFHPQMAKEFQKKTGTDILKILPKVLVAGEAAGCLTPEGAKLIDPTGVLQAGIPFCPPEGDAGTGMVATNAIAPRTGNVSAGTSIFAMIVLEKALSKVYEEIDVVATPAGWPVAMVHCNNCSSDIDAWAGLFREFAGLLGQECSTGQALDLLFEASVKGNVDCSGLLAVNYYSGEHITGFSEGRPLFVRTPDAEFSLASFFKTHIYSAVASLKAGLDILEGEKVSIDRLLGHGGYFKAKDVGQTALASACGVPVSVMETSGEGGAYGIALLAAYAVNKQGESLDEYLNEKVFKTAKISTVTPTAEQTEGFARYYERFAKGLAIEKAAVENLH